MNDGDVIQRVRDHYEDMGKSQQKVAEFFITSEEALYLSAARIAEILEVSHSTVVRTAQAIGFEGFPDLQAALQEQVFGRSTTAAAYELGRRKLDEDGAQGRDPASLQRRLMLEDAHTIELLANEIRGEDFTDCVERLITAQGVYVIGLRSSAPVARSFGMALRQLRPNCTMLEPGTGDLVDQIFEMNEQDLLFAICFGRYATMTLRCVARRMIPSWVASSAANSPVMRPSHITTMRWLMRRISGSSEEIMMIDLPCSARSLSRR